MAYKKSNYLLVVMLLAGIALLLVAMAGCREAAPIPTPTVAPTPTPTPTPIVTPRPTPTPAPALPIGMKIGERYHDIHVNKLGLQCARCHNPAGETYRDPLAQAFNPADRRACLSCHKEGSAQPFYGEDWEKARVDR